MNPPASSEQRAFRDFEQDGWKKLARGYHDHFAPLTVQAVSPLLASVGAGARLLDVCTGPGYAAAQAAARGAHAVGMDFSAPMIAQAARLSPEVRFAVGDAEEMPFADGCFDAVITNFGLLHLGRPETFLREAHRVLRRGGIVGFTVWEPPEQAIGFGIVLHAVQSHGNVAVALPAGPPFFRFSDPGECERALGRAGFGNPQMRHVPQVWQFPDADGLFHAMWDGTVRTGGLLRAQAPESLVAIRAAVRRAVEACRHGDVYEIPMPAVLASAVKP